MCTITMRKTSPCLGSIKHVRNMKEIRFTLLELEANVCIIIPEVHTN